LKIPIFGFPNLSHKITKILIANRGEIALRVIRTCRDLGITSVAVYSEIDRSAPHTLLADEAYPIGPAPARESYLRGDKIIEVAKRCGAEAIHPGYGFLAENEDFARLCANNNIVFIGPPAEAIHTMGSKTEARAIMSKAGVPVVPGCGQIEEVTEALAQARKIGYPVLIKADYGGGGKGMRTIHDEKTLPSAFESAKREALSAFGNGAVYLEKFLENPRHIEIQLLVDHFSNAIHLGERECSIQRRHQKVIEETPSVVIDQATRQAMGAAAVQAAKACGYRNAGTVEFMYSQGKFYFLEMNTRLQVEHPITEMITGLDLVREQIAIASGEPLRFNQNDIIRRGHAIECRIYSENENFLPVTGTISEYIIPQGPGVRVDGGVGANSQISVHYDPLIAKLITWGEDRTIAMARMARALREYRIGGVETTIPFCLKVLKNPDFISGDYDTGFVAKHRFNEEEEHFSQLWPALTTAVSLFHLQKSNFREKSLPSINNRQAHSSNWTLIKRKEFLS
jgi:acetyl-CoA carboxylase biotin carboxylase subunit